MKRIAISAACILATFAPARAEIKAQGENGFNVVHMAEVEATPDEIWKRLLSPKDYWSKEHSWSGSSAGFFIDAQAGGCFCELFQGKQPGSNPANAGSVEHMRVIFAQPGKVLRMQGALGPLQSEAVLGTLTVAMQPMAAKKGGKPLTKLSFSYVVGGYMRYKISEIAPAVDKVIGEQFASLIKPFGKSGAIEDKASNWSLDIDKLADDGVKTKAGDEAEADPAVAPSSAAKAKENMKTKTPPKEKFIKEGVKKPIDPKKER
jgi:hypothetical protein